MFTPSLSQWIREQWEKCYREIRSHAGERWARSAAGHLDHRARAERQRAQQAQVRRLVEGVWNEGRLELIDELLAADYLGRFSWLAPEVVGRDGVRELVSRGRKAHPGLYIKIEDQIPEDDLVVLRWRAADDAAGAGCSGISVVRLLASRLVDSHIATANSHPCRFSAEQRYSLIAGDS